MYSDAKGQIKVKTNSWSLFHSITSDSDNVFGIKSALIQHFESVHRQKNENKIVFKCNTCDEEFLRQSSYRQHIESFHEVKKSFNCYACVSEFALQSSLTQHIENVHEMKKSFKCKDCDNHLQSSLKEHLKSVHENKKPYRCDICENSFSTLLR